MAADAAIGFWVGGVCVAVVCSFGQVGNILSVITLAHPLARAKNFNLYLLFLGIFDTIVLIRGLVYSMLCLLVSYPCVYGNNRNVTCKIPDRVDQGSITYNEMFATYFALGLQVIFPLFYVSYLGNVYVTMVLSIHRCMALFKPMHWPAFATRERIKFLLCGIVVWAVALSIPLAVGWNITYENVYYNGGNISLPLIFEQDNYFNNSMKEVYLRYQMIVHNVLPVLTILLANVLIISIVIKRKFLRIGDNIQQQEERKSKSANRTTAQVVTISLLTLFSRAVMYAAMVDRAKYDCYFPNYFCTNFEFFALLSNNVNSAANFLLYCVASKTFRRSFTKVFYPCLKLKIHPR